jgi:glucan 1,3-beta-glucosidase
MRNFVIDMTSHTVSRQLHGIFWNTAQATSLQNIVIKMSDASNTLDEGLYIEDGSGGFISDLTFYGGLNGAFIGSQ